MLCSTLLIATPVLGEVQDTLRSYELREVEVREKRRISTLRASGSLQVLNHQLLENSNSLSVSDAVKQFSGVAVKDYGGIGGLKTVSVRSMGAEHTGVCYDGVNIGNCQSGQIDISRFSLDNVGLLSLAIGQQDDIFLPARILSSAGTLYIETRTPSFKTGRNQRIQATVPIGSFGMINPALTYDRRINSGMAMSVNTNYLRADGNYPFELRNGNSLITGKRNNSDINAIRLESNLYMTPTANRNITAKIYYYDSNRGLPGSIVYDNPFAAERLANRNAFVQVRYEERITDRFKLRSALKGNYDWTRYRDQKSYGDIENLYRQSEAYATVTGLYDFRNGFSLSLAQDMTYNYLDSSLEDAAYPHRVNLQTALSARYERERFSITGSLLNTYVTDKVSHGEKPDDREHLSPSISASVKPFEYNNLRIRLSYKDIFRLPTFNDMYYKLIGNTNLKPETTRQLNAGITWNGAPWEWLEYIAFTLDGYVNSVANKIVGIPTMFIWKMMNVGKVRTFGSDVGLTAVIPLNYSTTLRMRGNYSFTKATDRTDRNSKLWGEQLPYTPVHSANAHLYLENDWINLGYTFLYSGLRYSSNMNIAANRVEAYTDHSISADRNFRIGAHDFRIKGEVLNIGNTNYEVIRFYPMAGRNYRLTFGYRF